MPQQAQGSAGAPYFDPTDGKIHLPSGEVAPQGQQPPPLNANRGTSLPGGDILKAPPSLGRDPNAKDPSLRSMANAGLELGELGTQFADKVFPPATFLAAPTAAVLGGIHGYLNQDRGEDPIMEASKQAAYSIVPKFLSDALARGGNRVTMAMKGISNDLPGGEKLSDVFARMRAANRGPSPYGDAPGMSKLEQGLGIKLGGPNVIPVGAKTRLAAASEAAGKNTKAVEEADPSKFYLGKMFSNDSPEVNKLRQYSRTSGEPTSNKTAINNTMDKLGIEHGGEARASAQAAKNAPLQPTEARATAADTVAGQSDHTDLNAYRDELNSQRQSAMGDDYRPLTNREFADILLTEAKPVSTRNAMQISRGLRDDSGTVARKLAKDVPVTADENMAGQTKNAVAKGIRSDVYEKAPAVKSANKRAADVFTALDNAKPQATLPVPGMNTSGLRSLPPTVVRGLVRAALGSTAGNLAASTVEAVPTAARGIPLLQSLYSLFGQPDKNGGGQ